MTRTARTFTLANPTATAWFPLAPASEAAVIDMADARTVALRERLRNLYWLRGCVPLTTADIDLQCRKMRMIREADEVDEAARQALLVPFYGFHEGPEGWTIPDLDHHRTEVLERKAMESARGAAGGRASAAKRGGTAANAASAPSPSPAPSLTDEPGPADF